MKKYALYIFLLQLLTARLFSQSTSLFEDTRVSVIYLQLPADSLDKMIGQLINDRYLQAQFVFDDGVIRDTVKNVGLRLRGNTSLAAQKKSFKISFNEFESGRKYQGVRKLNLLGSHNDPTLIRQKLFYDAWAKAGMPIRRTAFVKLYINGVYRGLYTNAEEIDKEWLADVYGDNDGNLYKCTWPADLVYKGPDQQTYKAILNNPETRAYDLTTNETEDDYTRLVALISALNQPVDAAFPDNIGKILNVNGVLKAFALDVATGNWDDYFYNKNNYYLYDNPASGRFEFFTYDTDNTFGIDWLGKDWTKRNCTAWLPATEPRPLAAKLLAVPAFRDRYVRYLDTISRFVVHPDSIFPRIDALHQLITPAVVEDSYRTLDYGYTVMDFHLGFTQPIDGHSPYGIKPFLEIRYDSTLAQIGRVLSSISTTPQPAFQLILYPNPVSEWLFIQIEGEAFSEKIDAEVCDLEGRLLARWQWEGSVMPFQLGVKNFPAGMYRLRVKGKGRAGNAFFLKR